jgi:tetratricopeptide (TPR) repeat protein
MTVVWLVVGLMVASVRVGLATQDDPRLDGLFDALQSADGPVDAQRIEQEIWAIWSKAGDTDIDRLMESGTRAMAGGQYEEALIAFNAVIEMAPDFAEGWNKRATLYYLMNDYPASIKDIDRTLDLEPRHFGALSGLSMILLDEGRGQEALTALERAVRIHPFLPNAKARIRALQSKYGEPI